MDLTDNQSNNQKRITIHPSLSEVVARAAEAVQ